MDYRYSTNFRIGMLITLLFAFIGGIEVGRSHEYVLAFIFIFSIIYFAVLVFNYKIVITDEYIMVDIGKLGKKIERNWGGIYRVSRTRFSFLWMYNVYCRDKPTLRFTNSVANYIDLLGEIVKRSPNAIVDDSIRQLIK